MPRAAPARTKVHPILWRCRSEDWKKAGCFAARRSSRAPLPINARGSTARSVVIPVAKARISPRPPEARILSGGKRTDSSSTVGHKYNPAPLIRSNISSSANAETSPKRRGCAPYRCRDRSAFPAATGLVWEADRYSGVCCWLKGPSWARTPPPWYRAACPLARWAQAGGGSLCEYCPGGS